MINISIKIITTKQNIFITITQKLNNKEQVIYVSSLGSCGFKGKTKKTTYASFYLLKKAFQFLLKFDTVYMDILLKRKSIYTYFILNTIIKIISKENKLHINSISENMRLPYNGCRLSKKCNK